MGLQSSIAENHGNAIRRGELAWGGENDLSLLAQHGFYDVVYGVWSCHVIGWNQPLPGLVWMGVEMIILLYQQ